MRIYVAGSLLDVQAVQEVQEAVISAGHEIVLDWTRGHDVAVVDYADNPVEAGRIARDDLRAVMNADAVLVLATASPGRGMFVELGAALGRAERGDLLHLVVIGPAGPGSVFYYHPAVRRVPTVHEWLSDV